MSVPISLTIYCADKELKRQIEEDLCEYLPAISVSENECRFMPETLQNESSTQTYEDSDSEQVDTPLISTPIIQCRLRDFIARETPTASIPLNNYTPPLSYCNIENELNEDPLHLQSSTQGNCLQECAKKCLSSFPSRQIEEHRLNMMEMDKGCKDMLVMGMLQSCGVSKGEETRSGGRKRHKFNYQYDNTDICKQCFLYINGIGSKYLKNIKKTCKSQWCSTKNTW